MNKNELENDFYLLGNLSKLLELLIYVSNSDLDEVEILSKSEFFVDGVVFDRLSNLQSVEDVYSDLTRVRKHINVLLQSIDTGFEKSINKIDNIFKSLRKFDDFREHYPYYVRLNHPEDCIKFYEKLDQDDYNFIETGELLGITRQTVSKYFQDGTFIKDNNKKSNRISKKSIYLFFVKQNWDKLKKNNIK